MPEYRLIPSIDQLRQRPEIAGLETVHGPHATVAALRQAADAVRRSMGTGTPGDAGAVTADEVARAITAQATAQLTAAGRGSLRPLLNATGVVIHTNLGRAPLSRAALSRVAEVGRGYVNLEYDLTAGRRGSRAVHAESLLKEVTGAEAAAVVNNCAAATLLILAALGAGREVVVSRGELVEIGGGFRVPDVMAQSGAVLREVGTTNRTRVADFRAAIGPRTALLLRVHPSNFTITGFTEQPTLAQLVAAAREADVPLVEDLGSGCVLDAVSVAPTVQASLATGVDLVCFSGDKLLGGPQAGIIVGRADLVARVQTHPLMRALRVDKLTLAALEGTLLEYRAGRAATAVPVIRMLTQTPDAIEARAERAAARLHTEGWRVALVSGMSAVGGGSAPGVGVPTVLLAIAREGLSPDALEERLRQLERPVIARIEDGRVVLDLRTIDEEDDDALVAAVQSVG